MSEAPIIRYSEDKSTLLYVSCVETLTISRLTKHIFGAGPGDGAFQGAKTTLISFGFEESPLLEVVSSYAFSGCTKLLTADFSSCSNLRSLMDNSFNGCSSLRSVVFPTSNLTTLGEYSFYITGLELLVIPSCVKYVGFRAFSECRKIKNITIDPDSNIDTLSGCLFTSTIIRDFTIPEKVISFSAANFEYCSFLENVYVAEGNTVYCSIDGVIYSTNKKTIIYFPAARVVSYNILNTVENVGGSSFTSSKLTTVVFPEVLKKIMSWAFAASAISYVEFPASLTTIEGYAFRRTNLQKITIPGNVTAIGSFCFSFCSKLVEVILPSSLKSLGGSAFSYCSPSIQIKFASDSSFYLDSQYLIINKMNTSIFQYCGTFTEISIMSTITTIKNSCFSGRTTLESIIFEGTSTLQTIEASVFSGCKSLVRFDIPPSIVNIHESAFEGCIKLSSLSFGSSLSFIGNRAFYNCASLKSIVFQEPSFINIQDFVFAFCSSLSNFDLIEGISSLGTNCFEGCSSLRRIEIPTSVSIIGKGCFSHCGITECNIKTRSIKSIPSFMFYNSTSLFEVAIPENIESIGSHSFGFTNITTFTLPISVICLEQFCFEECHNMKSFTIPYSSNLSTFEFGVFTKCSSFCVINNYCNNFEKENEALYNKGKTKFIVLPPMSNIRSFSFPPSLTTIGENALFGCKNIFTVFIPDQSVVEIQTSAFEECTNLRIINLPISVSLIGNNVFKGCKHLQCGLFIENKDISYAHNLIKVSKMPRRCIHECIFACTERIRRNIHISFLSVFIFISSKAY